MQLELPVLIVMCWIRGGWCDFPVECGNSIPSWYLSGQSTVSSHPDKSRWQEQSSFRRHAVIWVIQTTLLQYLLSPCPWCMFLQEIISWTLPPGLSQPVLARCSFVMRVKLRRGPSFHLFIGLSLTPLLMLKASAGNFSPGLPESPPELL